MKKKLKPEWRVMPPEEGFPVNLSILGWRLQRRVKVQHRHKYVTIMMGHRDVLRGKADEQNQNHIICYSKIMPMLTKRVTPNE